VCRSLCLLAPVTGVLGHEGHVLGLDLRLEVQVLGLDLEGRVLALGLEAHVLVSNSLLSPVSITVASP